MKFRSYKRSVLSPTPTLVIFIVIANAHEPSRHACLSTVAGSSNHNQCKH